MSGRFTMKLLSLIFLILIAVQNSPAQEVEGVPPGLVATPIVPVAPHANGRARPRNQQSAPGRKDIPAIAKAANGAIVTIVMANNDKPITRGTGFLVSPDGVILTNYHVIASGNIAIVKFSDGTALSVDGVLAADKVRDLAIIKIHGKNFRALTLGNSDRVQIGEDVVAIGNPLGLELTVSNGILSGVRTVEKEGGKFLQVTAPISHGSSGGPLFNMAGEVIGITSMYFEGGENLNFAIPVNDAKQLLANQSVTLSSLPNEPEEAPPSKTEPSVKTEPVTPLQKSVSWMNHFLSEHSQSGNKYEIQNANAHLQAAFNKVAHDDLPGQEDCTVSIHRNRKGVETMTILSFADLDPAKIEVFGGGTPILQFITSYQAKQILILGYADGQFIEPYYATPNYNLLFDSAEAAEGFGRVFKHVVTLCKKSPEQPKKKTWTADLLGGEYIIEVREGVMHISIVKPPSDEAFNKYHIMGTEWVANNIVLDVKDGSYLLTHLTCAFNRPKKKNGEFVFPCYVQGAMELRVESDSRISGWLATPTDVAEATCVPSRMIPIPITFVPK